MLRAKGPRSETTPIIGSMCVDGSGISCVSTWHVSSVRVLPTGTNHQSTWLTGRISCYVRRCPGRAWVGRGTVCRRMAGTKTVHRRMRTASSRTCTRRILLRGTPQTIRASHQHAVPLEGSFATFESRPEWERPPQRPQTPIEVLSWLASSKAPNCPKPGKPTNQPPPMRHIRANQQNSVHDAGAEL